MQSMIEVSGSARNVMSMAKALSVPEIFSAASRLSHVHKVVVVSKPVAAGRDFSPMALRTLAHNKTLHANDAPMASTVGQ